MTNDIRVNAGLGYTIHFAPLSAAGELFGPLLKGKRAAIVTDDNVMPLYLEAVKNSLESAGCSVYCVCVPNGEKNKNIDTLQYIYSSFANMQLRRDDCVVALGGGVVGDAAGFAAATYMRGIPLFQVPTTLLAQVDSSVGGKTAVNLPQGKNLIGAFHQPKAVLIDTQTLKTLDSRQIRAGWAEIIKHGAISDIELLNKVSGICMDYISDMISRGCAASEIDDVISRNCAVKADFVEKDTLDFGARMALNFGHTVGHAIENNSGYGVFLHGEAVAIGMYEEAKLGERLGITKSGTADKLRIIIEKSGLSVDMPRDVDLRKSMMMDKKSMNGKIRVSLLRELGQWTVYTLDEEELESWLNAM